MVADWVEKKKRISTRDAFPERRPRPLRQATIVPGLLGRQDRDRVTEAQFLIRSDLLGGEDLAFKDDVVVSWQWVERRTRRNGRWPPSPAQTGEAD